MYINPLRRKDLFTCIYCCYLLYYVAYQDKKTEDLEFSVYNIY